MVIERRDCLGEWRRREADFRTMQRSAVLKTVQSDGKEPEKKGRH